MEMWVFQSTWRRCPTYGRHGVSCCNLCFCNLCRPPWLTSSSVLCNVCSVAYLDLSGHFKKSCVCLWLDTIRSYILPYKWEPQYHIWVSKINIIGLADDLSPGRRQAIIWTSAGILLIGPLGTNFNEFLIEIHIFSLKKMHLKMSSGKWRPFCLGLNV